VDIVCAVDRDQILVIAILVVPRQIVRCHIIERNVSPIDDYRLDDEVARVGDPDLEIVEHHVPVYHEGHGLGRSAVVGVNRLRIHPAAVDAHPHIDRVAHRAPGLDRDRVVGKRSTGARRVANQQVVARAAIQGVAARHTANCIIALPGAYLIGSIGA